MSTESKSLTSTGLGSERSEISRKRKCLLILLVSMSFACVGYLTFLALVCVPLFDPWLCENFNHGHEFLGACFSLIFNGLWILAAYHYHSTILRLFALLSTIFLIIFIAFLIIGLITYVSTLLYTNTIPGHLIIASFLLILAYTSTLIVQAIIIWFSFQLVKLLNNV